MKICKKHQAIPCLCNDTDKVIILVAAINNDFKRSDKLKELNLRKINILRGEN